MEKGELEPRPASPGPPIVPRSSRDGCKPIARRFQETVVPENQRILKAMGSEIHGLFVSGRICDGFAKKRRYHPELVEV